MSREWLSDSIRLQSIGCNNDFSHKIDSNHTYLTPSPGYLFCCNNFIFSSFCFSTKLRILLAIGVVFFGWLANGEGIGIRFGSSVKMRKQLKLQQERKFVNSFAEIFNSNEWNMAVILPLALGMILAGDSTKWAQCKTPLDIFWRYRRLGFIRLRYGHVVFLRRLKKH